MASASTESQGAQQLNGSSPAEDAKQWYDFVQVVITELNDTNQLDGEVSSTTASNQEDSESTRPVDSQSDRFYIEEPNDFIFEPDHYPKPNQTKSDAANGGSTTADDHPSTSEGHTNGGDHHDHQSGLNEIKNENKFTYATVVRENEGFLEYEYKNYTYKRNLYSNKLDQNLDLDYHLLNDYIDNHLNALIRGVSLCKWPDVGFGFKVAKQSFGAENIFFICGIKPDSPAEFGLRLGDILIEVDDLNTRENFEDFTDIEDFLSKKDSVHLVVIHESRYHFVKSNTDFLRNHNTNCEDIVIVSHSR